jgi:hypothetical protein
VQSRFFANCQERQAKIARQQTVHIRAANGGDMFYSGAILLCALLYSMPMVAQQAGGDFQSQLEAMHGKWFKAFDDGDGATMDKLETDNLVLVLPDGQIWPKTGARGNKQGKGDVGAQRILSNVTVRQFDNTAVLTGVLTTSGATERSSNGNMGTTVVFVRSGGAWKIASAQWTASTKK